MDRRTLDLQEYKYSTSQVFHFYFIFSLLISHPLLTRSHLSHRALTAGTVAVGPEGGATVPEPLNTPKLKLSTSNLNIFLRSFQIRDPKLKKTHETAGSG
jgi:hypothetical protein